MHLFVVTGASQKISTEKLSVLPKTLKKSMVAMGITLILYHMTEQFTNLWHFREQIYEYAESFVRKCSREKVQSWAKRIEIFQLLA